VARRRLAAGGVVREDAVMSDVNAEISASASCWLLFGPRSCRNGKFGLGKNSISQKTQS
jgi:hypothetical protein